MNSAGFIHTHKYTHIHTHAQCQQFDRKWKTWKEVERKRGSGKNVINIKLMY